MTYPVIKKSQFKEKKNLVEKIKTIDWLNPVAIDALLNYLFKIHNSKIARQNLISRIKKLIRNKTDVNNTYGSIAEFHSLYLLNKSFLQKTYQALLLPDKDTPDIEVIDISRKKLLYKIEVKSINPPDYWHSQGEFFQEISRIPSGKIVSIKVKNDEWKDAFKRIKNIFLKHGIHEIQTSNFEVKIIGKNRHADKTSIVGPTWSFWGPFETLGKKLESKLGDKPKQIERADVVLFYFYDPKFNNEDIGNAVRALKKEDTYKNKVFLWVEFWNHNLIKKFE